MRRKTTIGRLCGAAAGAMLITALGLAAERDGGGGGRGGAGAHIGSFSSGAHVGGYSGGYLGGSHIGAYPSGAPSGNRIMSHPGGYSVARPGWQTYSHHNWPGQTGQFNHLNAWGYRYGARYPFYSSWYHGNWYDHGNRWWHYGPSSWWWGSGLYDWGLRGYAAPWLWGYYGYYNPYCRLAGGAVVCDYSQPLLLAEPPTSGDANAALSLSEQEAMRLLDLAKNAFRQGQYEEALKQVDAAVKLTPEDRILHEFRGLVLFALGRYQESAAAIYAVLSAGPGWDWTTVSGLYGSVETYTRQLRALEKYVTDHPTAGDACFLLGYQYLVCGYKDAAAAQFANAARLTPKDQLSAQLAAALRHTEDEKQPAATEPAPAEPAPVEPAPAQKATAGPVDAARLVGDWTAKRPDGMAIGLKLTGDNHFTWKLEDQEKPREFSGEYSVSDNLLILKQNGKPMMVGQVKPLGEGGFNFRIVGDNPSDPGLNFTK